MKGGGWGDLAIIVLGGGDGDEGESVNVAFSFSRVDAEVRFGTRDLVFRRRRMMEMEMLRAEMAKMKRQVVDRSGEENRILGRPASL